MTLSTIVPASLKQQRAPASTATHNAGIDCLRGLAILLVTVHHAALRFRFSLRHRLLGAWLPKRLINTLSFNGYEAVFIFFVIPGFLINFIRSSTALLTTAA